MTAPAAHGALAAGIDWETTLAAVLPDLAAINPNLLFVFGSHQLEEHFPEILKRVISATGAQTLIGCSSATVISNDREIERAPALALLALALPGATLNPVRITPESISASATLDPEEWRRRLGVDEKAGRGWFLFSDPFTSEGDALMAAMQAAYPGAPLVGGLAAAGPRDRQTWLFHNGQVVSGGAVGLALGPEYDLIPLVSQGCEPIGQTWTITSVKNGWIETIGNRSAIDVLIETLNGLANDVRARARRNLLLGVAADEYRQEFHRGDFLVRSVTGFDQSRGAISITGGLRVGQTVQFQMRDAATADLDLRLTLEHAGVWLDGRRPIAAVVCSCESRGTGLFGTSHHDAGLIGRRLGSPMAAGCFCSAEFGPIGLVPFVHGQSVSLGLICESGRT